MVSVSSNGSDQGDVDWGSYPTPPYHGTKYHMGLLKMEAALGAVKETDPTMPVGWLLALIGVARLQDREGGLSIRELSDYLGVTYSSVAEIVKKLAPAGHRFPEALGVVDYEFSPVDERRKCLKVTPKGLTLLRKIALTLE